MNPLGNFVNDASEDQLKQALATQGVSYTSIALSTDGAYIVQVNSYITAIFSPKKDIFTQVSSLQRITNRFTIDMKKAYQIDFRYDTPVIRTTSL